MSPTDEEKEENERAGKMSRSTSLWFGIKEIGEKATCKESLSVLCVLQSPEPRK